MSDQGEPRGPLPQLSGPGAGRQARSPVPGPAGEVTSRAVVRGLGGEVGGTQTAT